MRSFIFQFKENEDLPRKQQIELQSETFEKEMPKLKVIQAQPPNCEALISNLSSEVTADDQFYIRSHFPPPKIDISEWKLEVKFDEGTRKSFSFSEILSLPKRSVAATLECAGNGRKHFGRRTEGEVEWGDGAVSTAVWAGVSVCDLVIAAGIEDEELETVKEFLFVGADGAKGDSAPIESKAKFVRALPVEKAMMPETIVAHEMNAGPLPIDHGYPARVIVPGWFAMASVKWVNEIILSTKESSFYGHYNGVKYVYETQQKDGKWIKNPITNLKVKSLITSPQEDSMIRFGKSVQVIGKAWSGSGTIVKVEIDDGDGWRSARLSDNSMGEYAWRNWSFEWTPKTRGLVTLRVRAIDEKGNVQSDSAPDNKYLYGYNGIHKISVEVT
jgi:DMSO/TMAO reductase YedYZ molybdopterin-dependent catalytic subunit